MPSRSFIVQLQAGVGQGILPDHRKMLPGIQYVVDWETFRKISPGALQDVIQVVTVYNDSITASGSFLPAQTATSNNVQLSIQNVLTTVSTTPINWNAAGFAAQGFTDPFGNVGVGANYPLSSDSLALTGPAGERYEYVFNPSTNISGTQVLTWFDENNRFVTNARPQYLVALDGLGTQYVVSFNDATTSPTTIGTKQGRFSGVAIVNVPSGNYGWIQTEGFCPAVTVSGNVTAGSTLGVVAATGAAGVPTDTTYSVSGGYVSGSALANNVFGTALTSGINTTIAVHIRSLRVKVPYNRSLNRN